MHVKLTSPRQCYYKGAAFDIIFMLQTYCVISCQHPRSMFVLRIQPIGLGQEDWELQTDSLKVGDPNDHAC